MHDTAFNIAKNPKYDGCQRDLASVVYKYFDKKTAAGAIKNEIMSNKKVLEELHKLIIGKFQNGKVHSSFIDKILGVDLADMQLIGKFNKGIIFLLCVIDIFSKYAWAIPLKEKKPLQFLMLFKKY